MHEQPDEQASGAGAGRRGMRLRIPLLFGEAVRGLLRVKPPPEEADTSETHDTHRVRVIDAAGQLYTEANLDIAKGGSDWSMRGTFHPDVEVHDGSYTLEAIESGARQRFAITRGPAGEYRLQTL